MNSKKNQQKNKKIINFKSKRKKWEMNIGIFIFLVFFVYICGVSIRYFNAHNISTYEVNYGSIITDNAYTGLILRTEEIVKTESSGYIQFYNLEGSRISYGNYIYTISENNEDITHQETTQYSLSSYDQEALVTAIQSYNTNYDSNTFNETYNLSSYITSILENSVNEEKISILEEITSENNTLDIYTTETTGILIYAIDGYEDLTLDTFSQADFDQSLYESHSISSGSQVTTNEEIFKLITDEDWYIIIQLDEADILSFESLTSVELRFVSDDTTTTANISLMTQDGITYGVLSLDKDMIRYSSDRFVEIELILENLEGYKIPISSVISREFYEVPLDYVTKGGDSGSNGVIVSNDDGTVTFVETNVYYQTTENAYIAAVEEISNQTILMEETSIPIVLDEITELNGVYVVNKGYAEFKCVTILTQSAEYYIVDDSMSYSINNYDRIALYGDSIVEYVIIN